MAAQRTQNGVDKKRKSRKKKARTEVSSSSESDSDVQPEKSQKAKTLKDKHASSTPESSAAPILAKKPTASPSASPSQDADTPMTDFPSSAPTQKPKKSKHTLGSDSQRVKPPSQTQEDFSAIYLRKIAAELADDLDKVRESPDFKANSVPMLIHALKQGESMFSVEERKRVVGATEQ